MTASADRRDFEGVGLMDGEFACPECGHMVTISEQATGRQVTCPWCESFVEVPYFPRLAGRGGRAGGRRGGRLREWSRATLLICGALLTTTAAFGVVALRVSGESRLCATFEKLRSESLADESAGRYGQALVEINAALEIAGRLRHAPLDAVDELRRRRDEVARRDVAERLGGVPKLDPEHGVGEALTLAARVESEPALATMRDAVVEELRAARGRLAGTLLEDARRKLTRGEFAEALAGLGRIDDAAGHLSSGDREQIRTATLAITTQIARARGVVLEPMRGKFTLGSLDAYVRRLTPRLAETLEKRGYLLAPADDDARRLWEAEAPYRLVVDVYESAGPSYLESLNPTTRIETRLTLTHAGSHVWDGTAQGRTRIPLPGMPAMVASRIAGAGRRDPEFERRMHADALVVLLEHFDLSLRGLPEAANLSQIVRAER